MSEGQFSVTPGTISKMSAAMALTNGGINQQEFDLIKRVTSAAHVGDTAWSASFLKVTPEEKVTVDKFVNWAKSHKDKPLTIDGAMGPGKVENYDKNTVYAPPGSSTADTKAGEQPVVPTVPKPGEGADKGIGVDQNALRVFAGKLKQLQDTVRQLKTDVDGVTITPGNFGAGFALNTAVGGSPNDLENGGAKDKLSKALDKINQALTDIQDDAETTAKKYDSIEDMNSMTADQLSKIFRESFNEIGPQGGIK